MRLISNDTIKNWMEPPKLTFLIRIGKLIHIPIDTSNITEQKQPNRECDFKNVIIDFGINRPSDRLVYSLRSHYYFGYTFIGCVILTSIIIPVFGSYFYCSSLIFQNKFKLLNQILKFFSFFQQEYRMKEVRLC